MTIWRNETPVPAEPGYYYSLHRREESDRAPEPTEVSEGDFDEILIGWIGGQEFPLEEFRWFGPVQQCKEG